MAIGLLTPAEPSGPTTPEGLGVGSKLETVKAAYPDLAYVADAYTERTTDAYSQWTIERDGYHVTFETGEDARTVGLVWVSKDATVPSEFCG